MNIIYEMYSFYPPKFQNGRKMPWWGKEWKARWAGFPWGSHYLRFQTLGLSRWWFWSIQANHQGPDLGWVIIFYFFKWEPQCIHLSRGFCPVHQLECKWQLNPYQQMCRSKIGMQLDSLQQLKEFYFCLNIGWKPENVKV